MMNQLIARLQGEVLHLRKQLKREGSNRLKQSQSQGKDSLNSNYVRNDCSEEKNEESDVDGTVAVVTAINDNDNDNDNDNNDQVLDDQLSMVSQVLDDRLSVAPTIVMQGTREEAMQKVLLSALYVFKIC